MKWNSKRGRALFAAALFAALTIASTVLAAIASPGWD
jgi:hypothetical protein